jgi:thiol-disulfide isomerase/thioredoxin
MGWVRDSNFRDILASMQAGRVKGAPAFNFSLPGADGKQHRQQDFLGKVVLLDFYYTGCGSCRAAHVYIDSIERLLADTGFRVVCISEDTDKDWFLKGTKTGKYASPGAVCLYTEGMGINHPVFRHYSVGAFPTLILVDKYGRLMENPADPVDDKGTSLVRLLKQGLAE